MTAVAGAAVPVLAGMVLGVRSDLRRRTAQSALREREAHLSSLLEAAGDAFLSVDQQGRVTAWNAQASALFGTISRAKTTATRPLVT